MNLGHGADKNIQSRARTYHLFCASQYQVQCLACARFQLVELSPVNTSQHHFSHSNFFSLLLKKCFKDFIYLFLERGKGKKKEGEKQQCVVASRVPLTGDLAHNPGMCTDGESNWPPFGFASWCSTHWATPARAKICFSFFIGCRDRGREGEKHWSVASCTCPYWGLNPHPGMCPDPESNSQIFSLQDDAKPTEPYQPGL